MALSKTFEMAFVVGAALQANFAQIMSQAQKKTSLLEKCVQRLNKETANLGSVLARRKATEEAQRAYSKAASEADKLREKIFSLSNPSSQMVDTFNRLSTATIKAKSAWLEQKNALTQLENKVKTVGLSYEKLARRQKILIQSQGWADKGMKNILAGKGMMNSTAGYAAATGIALTSKMSGVVQTGAGFDSAMARVGAVSGASGEDLLALREQAKELGKSTVWSSSQAAEGQQYLAMAGFNKEQIMKSMPGMLDLASAGGIDLGSAADIGSNILTGMGLDASDMGRVGDVLVNTFTKSNTNLTMLGETMKYAAPVAKSLGVSVEEAAAMAGKLGDAGIQGSMAGTTLRTVMLRLSAPSKEGAKALDSLGVKTTDAAGNMRKMPEILADLNKAMADMPESQKAAYTKAIFETEAMSGAFVLMEQAGKGALQEFISSVRKSGTAKEVASKQNDNLLGDYKGLTSALEGLSIAFYETLVPALRSATQFGTKLLGWVTSVVTKFPDLSKWVGIVAGGFGLMVTAALPVITIVKTGAYAFGLFKSVLGGIQVGMAALNVVLRMNPIGLLITGFTIAITAGTMLYQNWDTVKEKAAELWAGLQTAFANVSAYIGNCFDTVSSSLSNVWAGIQSTFSGLAGFVGNCFESAVGAIKTPINAMIAIINSVIEKINEYANVEVPSWVPGIGGKGLGFQLQPIAALASGGIATSSTIAQIGEGSEPEAVLPLSKLDSMLGSSSGSSGSINVNLTINVSGSSSAGEDIKKAATSAVFNLKKELAILLANERRLSY